MKYLGAHSNLTRRCAAALSRVARATADPLSAPERGGVRLLQLVPRSFLCVIATQNLTRRCAAALSRVARATADPLSAPERVGVRLQKDALFLFLPLRTGEGWGEVELLGGLSA